ncbi:hypothetical protein DE146DRAFT_619633 [Phaeosphaeria sp. MPI-PUGE-AT-0046c]|nr:hypothetical protein DE146DRAFT_619633 [Phaeosphaeria sp. MPI-PUGE-AT-0046c]
MHAGDSSDGVDGIDPSRVSQDCCLPASRNRSQGLLQDEEAAGQRTSLTKKQQRFLRLWYEEFAQSDAGPALLERCSAALATAIQTQPDLVFDYIGRRRKGSEDDDTGLDILHDDSTPPHRRQDSDPEPEPYLLAKANSHLSKATLALVEKYISACRRRRSPNDGRRSVNAGPFRCTFGCGYRTKRVFDWRRHEETHEPQELWLCAICSRSDVHNPFLVNRKDKFLKHAADKHTHVGAEEVLHKSKLAFVPRAELGCPHCGEDSANWDERCRHVLGHFEDEVERGMKRIKVVHEEADDGQGVSVSVSEDGSVATSVVSSRDEGDSAS